MSAAATPTPPAPAPPAPAPPAPAVETSELTKRYGDRVAVDHLDLTIERGEIFGLLGPNGAGKTTTILMLLGLTEPSGGHARVMGLDPTRDALAVKRSVGYLPDDVGFYDDLTGRENLRYTARLNRLGDEADARIDEVLSQVDLADAADRRVGGYSRGMRQRLGIADALVKRPSLLILDEPTVNIDPEGVRHILDLAVHLRDEQEVAIVLSSHLLTQVQQVCDRIGILVDGRLAASGTVAELAAVTDRWRIEVGVAPTDTRAGSSDVVAALRSVPAVSDVRASGEHWVVDASEDCRSAIVERIAAEGMHLTHLARSDDDLDAVYHRYFGVADGVVDGEVDDDGDR